MRRHAAIAAFVSVIAAPSPVSRQRISATERTAFAFFALRR
jgi:hypothetical protein